MTLCALQCRMHHLWAPRHSVELILSFKSFKKHILLEQLKHGLDSVCLGHFTMLLWESNILLNQTMSVLHYLKGGVLAHVKNHTGEQLPVNAPLHELSLVTIKTTGNGKKRWYFNLVISAGGLSICLMIHLMKIPETAGELLTKQSWYIDYIRDYIHVSKNGDLINQSRL